MLKSKEEKKLVAVLGTLLAELQGSVKTHYGSELHKAMKAARLAYRQATAPSKVVSDLTWVEFHNVTIALQAKTPKKAYTQLCDLLATREPSEWWTDTYSVGDSLDRHNTSKLFPRLK